MFKRGLLLVLAAILLSTSHFVFAKTGKVGDNPMITSFIDKMVKKHDFKREELTRLFAQVEHLPEIVERMNKPAEGLPWHRYRQIFVKENRIEQGVQFWRENEADLRRAEEKYGVPAEIIVAIIGVETRYGRHKGGFRVLDSLATLAVDYPRRSKFFTREMEEFLLLSRAEGFEPRSIMGSYAGAMGKPQFIASSYRRYAVDFNGDGVRDLLNSSADAIGSVANYLKRHGWKRGQSVVHKAEVSGNKFKKLVDKGLKPHTKVAVLPTLGVRSKEGIKNSLKTALIELDQKNGKEYWLGMNNFYAITRYNHSALYAMAVYQLGSAIDERRTKMASN
jgi:membrane-bound lytic murein transglycosylase B